MKCSLLFLSTLATLASYANAATCTTGLNYCGYNLVKKGHYREEIARELLKYHQDVSNFNMYHSLFSCGEGGEGWIGYEMTCFGGCVDGGAGQSDHC
ncbi:hypothetical protein FVEN_g13173 [Fusarium venenatum]|uniref:Uncharacterized protein n=2 Tax=Fusarium venenatum TaxID=56646 RepID=A0A2L2SYZ0_9HYPO|nr:uncharacterized protein FVRRES_04569 [Fusarium venenatum]KAG8353962.1 hypothetical protein FVEN_g13173 [Fusarium venenatum]CEI60133.1 unnamed protein product [Fusarium venenatum]